jgi:hypothetical protein
MSLARAGRGCGRRNQSARHRLPHPPTVPGILQFLGVQIADRSTQESSVQRAVQLGSLLPPERNLMRTAGWPGI